MHFLAADHLAEHSCALGSVNLAHAQTLSESTSTLSQVVIIYDYF